MKSKKRKGADEPKQPNPKVPKPKRKNKPDTVGKRLEEEAASVSQQEWGTRKQLVVFFGNASIGTRGGWGAKAVLQACRKVVERPNSGKPTDRVPGRVVTVDEFRTGRVSSLLNSPQPCEEELDSSKPTRPEDWKPMPGQVQERLLQSAWSKRFEAPVRGLMWCPWLAQATPGDLGKWVDRDCNAALNLQPAGESKWCPLELCRWPHRGRLPAQGKDYPALGFKKLRERSPKATAQQLVAQCDKCDYSVEPQPWVPPAFQVQDRVVIRWRRRSRLGGGARVSPLLGEDA
ncbi:hypothetical protein QJQ45_017636, partial [Haematococcus lacustris]